MLRLTVYRYGYGYGRFKKSRNQEYQTHVAVIQQTVIMMTKPKKAINRQVSSEKTSRSPFFKKY